MSHFRVAEEAEITKKVDALAELVGTEKFYLKVGGVLYKKGAEVGLRPDGLVSNSDAERIEAERILSTNIPSEHSRKRKVFNPSLGELIACIWQVDEFRNIRAQFITKVREKALIDYASDIKTAKDEGREEERKENAKIIAETFGVSIEKAEELLKKGK